MTLHHPLPVRRTALPGTATVCAVVPARGGSRGVPRKNLRPLGGEPLVVRAVRTLRAVEGVDQVVVTTDDAEIAYASRAAGARTIDRPAELAGDTASSESALLHALDHLESLDRLPDVLVFAQATSPFIDGERLAEAVRLVRDGVHDVAFSVVRTHAHLWRHGEHGPEGVNHDMRRRQRRQDMEPQFEETGAFYVMRTDGFRRHRHRFFGSVTMVEVDQADALEIDTEHDLRLAEELLLQRRADDTDPTATPIAARLVVTAFDGVHTDGSLTLDDEGRESAVVHRADADGVQRLRRAGRPVAVLTPGPHPLARTRAETLGVDALEGTPDKLTALRAWAGDHGVALHDIAYLGHDVTDVEVLAAVGWPVVPADAHPACRVAARHVLRRAGGQGAVRELADRVLAWKDSSVKDTTQEGPDHG
jgi:N-acylneuraminate cytidylyltransferase